MDREDVPLRIALPAPLAQRIQRVAASVGVDRERVVVEALKRALPGLEEATGVVVRIERCPRCAGRPTPADVAGIDLAACRSCGGVWLANHAARALMEGPSEQVEAVAARLEIEATAAPASDGALPCPVCATTMARVQHDGVGVLDVCAEHGTFFDGGELPQMVRRLRQRRANERAMSGADLDVDLERQDALVASVFEEGRRYQRLWGED